MRPRKLVVVGGPGCQDDSVVRMVWIELKMTCRLPQRLLRGTCPLKVTVMCLERVLKRMLLLR